MSIRKYNRIPPLTSLTIILALAATSTVASAQTVAAVSNFGRATLSMRDIQTSFLPSDARTSQEVLKDQAITGAGTQVADNLAGMAGSKLLTAPAGLGGLPVQIGLQALIGMRKRTVKGFTVSYLRGLSSDTVIPAGAISLNVDTDPGTLQSAGLQSGMPLLFRLQTSGKDFARILRTSHISYKDPGGSILAADVLGTDQNVVPCQTARDGDKVTLVPDQPLEAGEYAVVLPTTQVGPGIISREALVMAWDFRISQ